MGDAGLSDAGVQALAACPSLRKLSTLDLSHNRIGDAGARALAESPFLPSLTMLDLRDNPIGEVGQAALRHSSHLRHCEVRLKGERGMAGSRPGCLFAAFILMTRFVEFDSMAFWRTPADIFWVNVSGFWRARGPVGGRLWVDGGIAMVNGKGGQRR